MQSQDSNYAPVDRELFVINSYRIVRINCPVDVSVYNSKGALVAQIINNEPQYVVDSMIDSSYTEDGEKVFYLPADETYEIKMIATGNGILNYSMNEYSYATNDYAKIVNYYDIPIAQGNELTGLAPAFGSQDTVNTENGSTVKYSLSNSSGQLTPNNELLGVAAQDAVYSLSVASDNEDGGIAFGGGSYTVGSFAKVTAKPYEKCQFVGWYKDDVLVSEEPEYRFRIEQDVNLTAKFNGKRPVPGDGSYSLKIVAGVGGRIVKGADGYYSDVAQPTLIAEAEDGYRFRNWTSTDGGTFSDATNATTIFSMPANETIVTANFELIDNTTPAQNLPTIAFTAPYSDTMLELKAGMELEIKAQGTDCDIIDLYINNTYIASSLKSNSFSYNYMVPATGIYSLGIFGTNNLGNAVAYDSVNIVEEGSDIINPNIAPTIKINHPSPNTTMMYENGTVLRIDGNATNSTITDLYINGTFITSCTNSNSFSFDYAIPEPGTYYFSVYGTNKTGNAIDSGYVIYSE